jgi:hypothetical protein
MNPWWCRAYLECWAMIMDKWFMEEYLESHNAAQDWRLSMQGPTHHQGSHGIAAYKKAWVHDFIYLF